MLNYLKRNESSLAYNRIANEAGNHKKLCRLIECFGQLVIPFEKVLVRNHTPNALREDHYEFLNENVIEMQSNKKAITKEVQSLLGIRASYFDSKGLNATTTYI